MTRRTLKLAGWFAMASAFASLPVVWLSWNLEGRVDAAARVDQTCIQIAGVLVFLVVTLSLKKLLNSRFNFYDTDKSINFMVTANLVSAIVTIAAIHSVEFKDTFGTAALLILMVQGFVQVRFGYLLLKLQDDLGGLLKPFCYANMATGICLASVLLILPGILVSAISDLMLGTIFFNLARSENAESDDAG